MAYSIDSKKCLWRPDCSLVPRLFSGKDRLSMSISERRVRWIFSWHISTAAFLPTMMMRERTLCRPTRVQILLIYKKHYAMMSLFLVMIGLFYFKRNIEIWSNGWPITLKFWKQSLQDWKSMDPWRNGLLTTVIPSSVQGSGNQTNQTVHDYLVASAVILRQIALNPGIIMNS